MEKDGRIKEIAFWRIIHFYKNIVLFKNSFFVEKTGCFSPKAKGFDQYF